MPPRKRDPNLIKARHSGDGGCPAEDDKILAPSAARWVNGVPHIELLFFHGCPNCEIARRVVKELLHETGGHAIICEVKVSSSGQARQLKFIGSPTLRIDGRDVDPVPGYAAQYGLQCRVYAAAGKLLGYPPREMVLSALKEAGYVA